MRRILLMMTVTALSMSGCGIELPSYHLSEYSRRELLGPSASDGDQLVEVPQEVRAAMDEILFENYSPPWYWDETQLTSDSQVSIYHGADLFREHCIHCHGLEGGGDGPTAQFLYPRPRDYRRGVFKWKSTQRTGKPTKEDLLEIIKQGALGTSMPPFLLLPEEQLNNIADYVIYLSKRGEVERRMLLYLATEAPPAEQLESDEAAMTETLEVLKEVAAEAKADVDSQWAEAQSLVVVPEQPRPEIQYGTQAYRESLKRGKELYLSEKASCYKCHSADGKAKDIAPSERDKMFDDWGNPNFPRNLTLGLYRGGRRPVDLYRRIHQGIAGSGMPEGGRNLKPDEIWDLVNFVRALPYQPELLENSRGNEQAGGQGH